LATTLLTVLRSISVNILSISAAMIMALVWIVLSGIHHNDAVSACTAEFGDTSNTAALSTAATNSGHSICNIFTFVQIGVVGGLWVLALVTQSYVIMMTRIYSSSQRRDHQKYNSIISLRQSHIWDDPATRNPAVDDAEGAPVMYSHPGNAGTDTTDSLDHYGHQGPDPRYAASPAPPAHQQTADPFMAGGYDPGTYGYEYDYNYADSRPLPPGAYYQPTYPQNVGYPPEPHNQHDPYSVAYGYGKY
jgi:hypothetical protein